MFGEEGSLSYGVTSLEELQEKARIKNQVELDKCCHNIWLCIGWSFVIIMFIYLAYLNINGPP